jgi:hypothetical protein
MRLKLVGAQRKAAATAMDESPKSTSRRRVKPGPAARSTTVLKRSTA